MTSRLLLSVFPTFAVGGAQIRFAALANHFGASWRHAIVAMDGNLSCRERLDPSLQLDFPSVEIRKGDTIGNVMRFRRILQGLRPDALLTNNFGSIEWAIANRTGLAHHVHVEDGFGPEERDQQLPRRVWLRRIFLRGRAVVLPSRTLLRIATQTWGLNPDRLHYVPNGIDLDRFAGPAQPAPWPGQGPVIGTVAALRPEKNIARLLRAFRIVVRQTPARLVVIGDGAERPMLEQLARDLDIAPLVSWAGHVARPAALIKAFDVFAMSSDTEQMPISLLEAMAAGLAVAATDVGDIGEMVAAPGRHLVVPRDDDALAGALLSLAHDPSLRQRLGAENRAKAERDFDEHTMFTSWATLLGGTPLQPC